jgi:acetyl esterase/lipase
MPSYTLAPDARVAHITRQAAAAVEFAASLVEGPVRIAGHSAGGHLASRLLCTDIPLSPQLAGRIAHVVSISGISDVRPMLRLALNETFGFDEAEAAAESPALHPPRAGASITCWVGGAELPEFIRQNDLLANIWTGLGAATESVHAPGKNHFTVLYDLLDADSELTRRVAP